MISAALAVLGCSRALAEVSVSSRTARMMRDLESVSADSGSGESPAALFDGGGGRRGRIIGEDPRGNPVYAGRVRHVVHRPVTRNPAVKLWLAQGPRLAYAGKGRYEFTPPPPRLHAYPPNPFPYDNRGWMPPYAQDAQRTWSGLRSWTERAWAAAEWWSGFGPPDDGGAGRTFGIPGYRYVRGEGYVPDFGMKDGYRFVPGRGVIP